ncbi:MAG: hypothetical protein JOZ12_07935, partial [Sinobacteraceae bacterium]|nr:hypothetical protein [Nevskiaceae bacterium]
MFATKINKGIAMKRLLPSGLAALAALCTASTHAAAPGISGGNRTPTFDLIAAPAAITQPDGQSVYSWGYGCN